MRTFAQIRSAVGATALGCLPAAASAAPTHLVEQPPAAITNLAPGVTLVDFGRVGNIELRPPRNARGRITVHFGEALKNGRVDRQPPADVPGKTKQLWSVRPLFITTYGDPEVFPGVHNGLRVDDRKRSVQVQPNRFEQPAIESAKSRKAVEQLGPVRRSRGPRTHPTEASDPAVTGFAPYVMLPAIHSRSRLCFASFASLRFRPALPPVGVQTLPFRRKLSRMSSRR